MALSLGVHEGSKIKVGDVLVSVQTIVNGNEVEILYGDQQHLITDSERTEVAPNIFISCGVRDNRFPNHSRLAFEAARNVPITRI